MSGSSSFNTFVIHHDISKTHVNNFIYRTLHDLCMIDRIGGSFFIGLNQTGYP